MALMTRGTAVERGAPSGGDIVGPGIAAGVVAGLGMGLFTALAFAVMGLGFWFPARAVAATFYGLGALVGGAESPFAGLVIHLFVASLFGVIFAGLVTRRTPPGRAVLAGLVFSFIIWAFMRYLAVPLLNPVMAARLPLHEGLFFFSHLIYGVLLGITPSLRRGVPERPPRSSVERPAPVMRR